VPVDLPLGEKLDWKPVPRPTSVSLTGAHILARPVNAESDAVPLFSVSHPPDGDPAVWTYLPIVPMRARSTCARCWQGLRPRRTRSISR
jgi:hypothetical protein